MSNEFEKDSKDLAEWSTVLPPYYIGQMINNVTGEIYLGPNAKITAFAIDTPSPDADENLELLLAAFPPTLPPTKPEDIVAPPR